MEAIMDQIERILNLTKRRGFGKTRKINRGR
ncbi:hypothetical protein Wcon_01638 [Wolbachia endosymbiont of Cylisticus convexus]|nr:hypothetical protein Wcon_01638 [Wolbachia endosymbiont of Cylisticus convexus]